MAVDKQLYTPISILLGGALIGVGLFLGLRERAPARPEPQGASSRAASEPRESSPPPSSPVIDRAAVQRAVERALEAQRAAVVERCIPPAARGGGPSRLHINITFDKDGNQIARGIIPERGDPRLDLSACATDALPSLTIPPQGAPIALDLVWTLP